jgi:hypothetical protein
MPMFDVCFGADVPCYGSTIIEADSLEAAIEEAQRAWQRGDEPILEPCWDGMDDGRIVDIRDENNGALLNEQIDL